jgi:hypothetical protein
MSLPLLRADLAQHLAYGTLAAWIGFLTGAVLHGLETGLLASAILPLVAGIAKEVNDWRVNSRSAVNQHEVSFLDIVATATPGILPAVIFWSV